MLNITYCTWWLAALLIVHSLAMQISNSVSSQNTLQHSQFEQPHKSCCVPCCALSFTKFLLVQALVFHFAPSFHLQPALRVLVALQFSFCIIIQMPMCLLEPFKGVNTEVTGHYVIIFDAVYVSFIFSSPIYTLDNRILFISMCENFYIQLYSQLATYNAMLHISNCLFFHMLKLLGFSQNHEITKRFSFKSLLVPHGWYFFWVKILVDIMGLLIHKNY